MIHFGFSYIGMLFLLMLFVPNIIWTKHKPEDYEKYVVNENKVLLLLERIGEVLVSVIASIFSDFNLRKPNLWTIWLVLAVLAMLFYEGFWIKYFRSEQKMVDFYASFLGIPVAGATLPVLAFFYLGIYGANIFLIMATIILGIGHIGIHLSHKKEVLNNEKRRGIAFRIIRMALLVVFVIVFGGITVIIGARNTNAIRGCVHSANGIEEEGYVELCGQEQYYLIRGEDVSNPIIIWIHGGPASPDTLETYTFSNYLKDDYTVVAWNQRGSGRTYYKNEDKDEQNDTATFVQIQADLDALVDYVCDRFQQEKVILVGHSWGTMVGSKYAIEHPDKVAAYIGVGQMGALGGDIYAYEDALSIAMQRGDDTTAMIAAFEQYQANGKLESMLALRNYVAPYHVPEKENNYLISAVVSPYLGVYDVLWFGKQVGSLFDFIQLNRQLFEYVSNEDVYAYGTDFQVPVGFISGSCDWITPVKRTEDYYNTITAPRKEMQLIDGWGHMVPYESPKEFADTLKQVLEKLTPGTLYQTSGPLRTIPYIGSKTFVKFGFMADHENTSFIGG